MENAEELAFAEENLYLNLCPDPIRFEPVSKVTNIFYDDANQQVFAVRSGGATGVVVKGRKDNLNCSFRMEDKGPVLSIKFSPDLKILTVQRSVHSVEFMNFVTSSDNLPEYSQTCKNKNATILGFIWIAFNEVKTCLFNSADKLNPMLYVDTIHNKIGTGAVSSLSRKKDVEILEKCVNKCGLVFTLPSNILVISSTGGLIQPFQLKPGNIYKFPKLDIDQASPQKCSERDVSIASLYNQTAVLILRHKPKSSTCSGAEIDVYVLNREKTTPKSQVLKLDTSGRFAINVIDNLIIVHHQASKSSMIFDVRLTGGFDGYATYHQTLVVPMPIKSFKLKLPMSTATPLGEKSEIECELYSVNWVVFQPNVIIDARLGCLWFLQLKLDSIKNLMHDKIRLVEFFLQRSNGKKYILQLLQSNIMAPGTSPPDLILIAGMFDKLNENYRSFLDVEMQSQMSLPVHGKSERVASKGIVLVDQQELYTHIFSNFPNCSDLTDQLIVIILTEYVRSLSQFQIPVQHYIYELIIHAMVRQQSFYQLHQYLQYHVVSDSKPLACLLLSLEGVYPAAYQLALDMLKRLSTANDLIVEILINKQKIIPALRFVQSCERTDHISARKFLDAAMKTKDKSVFYAVFKFFEERNIRLRGTPIFESNELCDIYVQHFHSIFGKSSACSNFFADGAPQ